MMISSSIFPKGEENGFSDFKDKDRNKSLVSLRKNISHVPLCTSGTDCIESLNASTNSTNCMESLNASTNGTTEFQDQMFPSSSARTTGTTSKSPCCHCAKFNGDLPHNVPSLAPLPTSYDSFSPHKINVDTVLYPTHVSFGGDILNSGLAFMLLLMIMTSICTTPYPWQI